MRGHQWLLCALSLLLHRASTSPAQHGALRVRQDSTGPTSVDSQIEPAPTITPSGTAASISFAITTNAPSSSPTEQVSASTDVNDQASVTANATVNTTSSRSNATMTIRTLTLSVSSTSVPAALPTSTIPPDANSLPIGPVISPGLGVAGVLLIGFGIAYTFIGIRQKWLHIFCSVMYLVVLAITVLLVYVASPPVGPATQGAYLVAAFAPGLIIGAASLIFKEIVEGFGCLLGGFCFSMWLLCLAPGGLIHSNGGRIGLIITFSAVCYMLSFSHYTRTYSLIGCISFAGATSIVLGIDCFSRAGLKEFWIYNWNLNMAIFPLGTSTYPTTRGIKVESAVIVIITLVGVMSQFKLWNLIKDRRTRREVARRQDAEDREHLEANLGQHIESTNTREKAYWENIYGRKGAPSSPSMNGSTNASTYVPGDNSVPPSIRDIHSSAGPREIGMAVSDGMEMHNLPPGGSMQRNSREVPSTTVSRRESANRTDAYKRHHRTDTLERLEVRRSEHLPTTKLKSRGSPPVEPLPFRVPTSQVEDDNKSTHSVTTNGFDFFDNTTNLPAQDARDSNRNSGQFNSQRKSGNGMSDDTAVPHFDERASSVAATLDELTDEENDNLPQLSRPGSRAAHDQPPALVLPKRRGSSSSLSGVKSATKGSLQVTSDTKLENRKSMPSFADLEKAQNSTADPLYSPSTNLSDKLELRTKPVEANDNSRTPATRRASLKKEFLPQDQPAVASIYRTNEWAKHQATAEAPIAAEIEPESEEGVSVDYRNEAAVPVDMLGLQQTALTGHTSMARTPSQASSTNPYVNVRRTASSGSNGSPTLAQGPMPPVPRTFAQSRVNGMRSGSHSNTFIAQPLIESHTEDSADLGPQRSRQSIGQQQPYLQPNSSGTLMGRREDMLTARKSHTMLPGSSPGALQNATSSTNSLISLSGSSNVRQPPIRQSSTPNLRMNSVYSNFDSPGNPSNRQSLLPSDSMSIRAGLSPTGQSSATTTPIYEEPESASALGLTAGQNYDEISLSQRKQLIRQNSLASMSGPQGPPQRPVSQITQRLSHGQSLAGMPASQGLPQRSELQATRRLSHAQSPTGTINQAPFDAHAPRRGPSFTAATAQQQQSRLANWRSELSAGERLSRTQSTLLAHSQDEAMRRQAQERRQLAETEQRREWERSMQQGALDERMRSGGMLRTHAEVLRKMQQQADAGS